MTFLDSFLDPGLCPYRDCLLQANKDQIRTNLARLKKFDDGVFGTLSLGQVYLILGINEEGRYRKLSVDKDEDYYDIFETYDLKEKLGPTNNWDKAWKLIALELGQDSEYGPVMPEIICRFLKAFQRIESATKNYQSTVSIERYAIEIETGLLVFIPYLVV
jgi:hypothetical protein